MPKVNGLHRPRSDVIRMNEVWANRDQNPVVSQLTKAEFKSFFPFSKTGRDALTCCQRHPWKVQFGKLRCRRHLIIYPGVELTQLFEPFNRAELNPVVDVPLNPERSNVTETNPVVDVPPLYTRLYPEPITGPVHWPDRISESMLSSLRETSCPLCGNSGQILSENGNTPCPRCEFYSPPQPDETPSETSSDQGPPPECVACRDAYPTVAFLECRHLCLCSRCSSRVQACPMCRNSGPKIDLFVP